MERSNAPSGRPWNPHALSRATKDQTVGKPVSRPYIDNLADGSQSNPSIHAITAIAAALNIPARYLLPDCEPDDLPFVVWSESAEAQYLLRLLQGLSTDSLGQVTALAEECRELENLPPVERPSGKCPTPPARRWFRRRVADAPLSPDEVAHQMARSLLGKSDEE
jgi:transcriptional regulator with XRE-family HTH domain